MRTPVHFVTAHEPVLAAVTHPWEQCLNLLETILNHSNDYSGRPWADGYLPVGALGVHGIVSALKVIQQFN